MSRLTRSDAKELAALCFELPRLSSGPALRRGREYAKKGRVLGFEVRARGVEALVAGSTTARYEVEVELLASSGARFTCTCPAFRKGTGPCKHAVAAVTAWGQEWRAVLDRQPPVSCEEPPPGDAEEPRRALWLGMPRDQLEAWAGQHACEEWLVVAAEAAVPSKRGAVHAWFMRHERAYPDVGSVLCHEPHAHARYTPQPPHGVGEAVIMFLRERSAAAARGRVEDVRRQAAWVRPSEPVLGAAFDRLVALRDDLLTATHPRPLSLVQASRSLLITDPTRVRYLERVRAMCGRQDRYSAPPAVEIDPGGKAAAAVRCDCPQPPAGGCSVRLEAVSALLDQLGAPRHSEMVRELGAELATHPWERTLRSIDDVLAAAGRPATRVDYGGVEASFAWRLTTRRDRPELEVVMTRPRKRGDGWIMKQVPGAVADRWIAEQADATDQLVFGLLRARPASDYARQDQQSRRLLMERCIRLLVGHPRVFARSDSKNVPVELRLVPLELVAERPEEGGVRMVFRLGESRLSAAEAARITGEVSGGLAWDVNVEEGVVRVAEVTRETRALIAGLAGRETRLPLEAEGELVRRLPGLSEAVPTAVAPELRGRAIGGDSRIVARLTLQRPGVLDVAMVVRPIAGLPTWPPGEGPEVVYTTDEQGTAHVARDFETEQEAAHQLATDVGLPASPEATWHLPDLETALEVIEALEQRPATSVVTEWADERRASVAGAAGVNDLRLRLEMRGDWFGMSGQVELGDAVVPLGALLAAMRDGQRYVRVDTERWMRVTDALREAMTTVAELSRGGGEVRELSRFAAPLVEALEAQGATVDAPRVWRELLQRLHSAAAYEPKVPRALKATLRDYQVAGFQWLARLAHWGAGACLADDMGLGKTVQALALLLHRVKSGPALVVAPTSVGFNWIREAERFAPTLSVRLFRGRHHLDQLGGLRQGDVIVTSYELVARYAEDLAAVSFGTMVLDEAQAIKNPMTKRAKAIFGLDAEVRVALTGTPVENHTGELWSLFHAIAPGLLGSANQFRDRFVGPIERDRSTRHRALLSRIVRPFILRRLKSEVARELPPRTDVRLDVDLSPAERRRYDTLRKASVAALTGQDTSVPPHQRRFQVLAALTRLRQLACHPRLVDPQWKASSAKLDVLRSLLVELRDEGHRALVFSQFTGLLAEVRAVLDQDGIAYRYLDGSTPATRRRDEIDRFQAGEATAFLLSLKAGGTGLNLTAADYVIHLDPWWNPAVEDQATDRAHRIGQDKPVTVYRLVSRGTLEEAILDLHANKRELVKALLDGTGSAAALSTEELVEMIGGSHRAEMLDELVDDPEPESPRKRLTRSDEPAARATTTPSTGTTVTPSGHGDLVSRLEATLDAAVADNSLRASSATVYRRAGRRLLGLAGATRLESSADVACLLESLEAEVAAGARALPISQLRAMRATSRWLVRALEVG